jgi:predicted AAA+ superfamily ATPase
MDALLPRHLGDQVKKALAAARAVNLIGPRQVGKTTLVRDLLAIGRFISLDDTGVLAAIEADPYGQLATLSAEAGTEPVVIDEAQRSRQLAMAIKRIVDERRQMGQFLLTGSSNVFAAAHVSDSLAGRVQTLTLWPLSAAEIHRCVPTRILDWASRTPSLATLPQAPAASRADYIDLVIRGGYPEIRFLPDRARRMRYRDAIDMIVDRDVADVLKIRKGDALRRLIGQLAARTAGELAIEDMCSAVGVRRETIESYLDALTRLCLVTRLSAWASGPANRDIKRPKVHLLDTGIAAALRGYGANSFDPDADPAALGPILETYVHNELLKSLPYQDDEWTLWHWRNRDRREIDILCERGRQLVAIEVKAAATVSNDDFKTIRWFKSEGPGNAWDVAGIVLYLGAQPLAFGDDLFALPLSILWAWDHP